MTALLSELAAFLRTRRERLSPTDVALPRRGRVRRTPGLRREEVAELSGLSVDYVTRLEQGRGVRPSADALDALGRALLLDHDELAYLFALAGQRLSTDPTPSPDAMSLARLVHDLSPLPAMLVDHRFDMLAWNPEMSRLLLDFDTIQGAPHNALTLCFTPAFRDFYPDRTRVLHTAVADLRATWAAHPEDAALTALVQDLSRHDEFTRLWNLHEVRVNGRGQKPLLHPGVGPLTVDYEVLNPLQNPTHRLIVYRAADPTSQSALDALTHAPALGH
ncbi:helix-turn-helix transcriptional regulator [Actinokineospora enzanensis]|uniref:helix-turn-helix transcriptional regulator n=1 Tax=Actinokineospora enzanensis TaxID=155975 RepID=UPI00037EBB69|nr:helix-turn-helix transcriptional regulator [Actinokineospora enzanensis]